MILVVLFSREILLTSYCRPINSFNHRYFKIRFRQVGPIFGGQRLTAAVHRPDGGMDDGRGRPVRRGHGEAWQNF